MRAAFVTILPMLAAAVLVMSGGERLARRQQETRIPTDRGRLLDFAEAFRNELERLDDLYARHLDEVVAGSLGSNPDEAAEAAAGITGVALIRIFKARGSDLTIRPPFRNERLPEIEMEARKRPLDPNTALILDAALLEARSGGKSLWLPTKDARWIVRCSHPEPGVLGAVVVDLQRLREQTNRHLAAWLATPLTPLRESGDLVSIGPASGPALAAAGSGVRGTASFIVPARNLAGDWQIRSWDRRSVRDFHDSATLAVACAAALFLTACGVLLHLQQKRALRLAAERVSFVNRVSHELGSPLTNLSLNLDLATEMLDSRPVEARRRLDLVAEEIERLSRLVANVLTFSRRDRDTLVLKPAPCHPDEVVRRTLENFRPALERRGVVIEMDLNAGAAVLLDPDALSQIAGNLISNVEKYAAAGAWLGLACGIEAGYFFLEIRDRGPGIPAAARERIFKPFERVHHQTNEGASGTGLGLAIGRDLARRMGGTLELPDHPELTVFLLRIPAPPALRLVSDPNAA